MIEKLGVVIAAAIVGIFALAIAAVFASLAYLILSIIIAIVTM